VLVEADPKDSEGSGRKNSLKRREKYAQKRV
jgi:hypothetical protein